MTFSLSATIPNGHLPAKHRLPSAKGHSFGRKFGKDRSGNQRYQCMTCRKTFSDRPLVVHPKWIDRLQSVFDCMHETPDYNKGDSGKLTGFSRLNSLAFF
jgi:hypothetical protein